MAAYKGVVPSGSYTFNASAKTITFNVDYNTIALSDVMLVTNVTSNVIIYDPTDATKKGTLSGTTPRVLTLVYDTTSMSNTDVLQIIIGNSTLGSPLPDGAATESTLSTLNTKIPSNLTVSSNRLQVETGVVTVAQATAANLNATVTGTVNVANATGLPTQIYTSATGTSPSASSATNPVYVSVVEPAIGAIVAGNSNTVKSIASTASNNFQNVDTACKLTGWYIYNNVGFPRKVVFFDVAGAPVSGTTPAFVVIVPPFSAANVSFPAGIRNFTAGLGIGITALAGNVVTTDNGFANATGAGDVLVTLFYKK